MLLVLHTAVCYSPHVSQKIIVCFSNIATHIVEFPGIWRQWLGCISDYLWGVTEQAFYRWVRGVLSMCKILIRGMW